MNKLSTKNLEKLVNPAKLKELCKAISVLAAIICPDWEFRYYSYQENWSKNEELFEMRDGQGNHILILFQEDGICINGFDVKSGINILDSSIQQIKTELIDELPEQFNEFIYEEPVKSIGTTFCIWSINGENWKTGDIKLPKDNCNDALNNLLEILDGNPISYRNWAEEYYECELNIEYIEDIYKGDILSKEKVIGINQNFEDYEQLEEDLAEIGYNYDFE